MLGITIITGSAWKTLSGFGLGFGLISNMPDAAGKINATVVLVGGTMDWMGGPKQTIASISKHERFQGSGLRLLVLPNETVPLFPLKTKSWARGPHPICAAIIQHAWECLGALYMIGQSRGSWWVQEWAISHPH